MHSANSRPIEFETINNVALATKKILTPEVNQTVGNPFVKIHAGAATGPPCQ